MRVLIKPQAALSLSPTSLQHLYYHHHPHQPNRLISRLSKRYVHLHGTVSLKATSMGSGRLHRAVGDQTPPDPDSLASQEHLETSAQKLSEWFDGKSNILCLTGAGISTESGIPDYRGHGGSYRKGHKPMVHDQFINSDAMRRRYWGRAMVGWRDFATALPNEGHVALKQLEAMGKIGVSFPDDASYYNPMIDANGSSSSNTNIIRENSVYELGDEGGDQYDGHLNRMSILTQNVDGLHRKATTQHVTELHGRNDRVRCMQCGAYQSRYDFHDELEAMNEGWMNDASSIEEVGGNNDDVDGTSKTSREQLLRPDGDAYINRDDYDAISIPPCQSCQKGFVKPDVVFFGDSVPRHVVDRCYGAINACDGLLCIGSSLAVHSAYRFVLAASKGDIPIAILNVGETRAEVSGLELLKVEAPSGPTLAALVRLFEHT
eukprot:CAMPEP_0198256694 /NCGR_PEP_ID=MMETSP1447-20131203/6539_1 /TAXON_ID=420782 /ORGANISM="Chaetoceros dichaeta, Strain CCMP1751" /LENGTH=432 /DNA_ID=CAMNT_0043943391 /DNA_START=220 /DNA_END=1518 /DNA_ORIENTATION=-